MKVTKILIDLLKRVEKSNFEQIAYYIDKDYVYFTPDGFKAYKIPGKQFLIDLEKINKIPSDGFKKVFNDIEHSSAYKTNTLKNVENKWSKKSAQVVKIENDKTYAWVNVDYLKDFEPDCTFKILSPKSPVFIYEEDILVGVILPVYVQEV